MITLALLLLSCAAIDLVAIGCAIVLDSEETVVHTTVVETGKPEAYLVYRPPVMTSQVERAKARAARRVLR